MAVAPSPCGQAGPVKAAHRQALELEESQERDEAVFVLKFRSPPLLLLLLSKHPRGKYDCEVSYAVVTDQPTCPAAASHVAWSSIRPYPLSAHVPEVTMGYTMKLLLEVLHWLRGPLQKSPVVAASQSVVPHAQLFGLAAVPSVVAQTAKRHRLSSAKQTRPVADVQAPEAPQTQGAGLAVAPSPWAQAGPVKAAHRQALEEEESQERVEAVLVPKYK